MSFRTFIPLSIFGALWLWLAYGCASVPTRYCDKYEIKATIYVIDDLTFDEFHGGGIDRDGVCWADSNTIYVRGGTLRRPSDWILGHEIKHLSKMFGNWHSGETGYEER